MNFSTGEWAALAKHLDDGLDVAPEAQAAWVESLADLEPHLKPALLEMLERNRRVDDNELLLTLPKFTSVQDASKEGATIGPYRLIRELGRGGMGAVWLADRVDGALTRQVALKLPHAVHDAQFLERFRREADILASFTHPNIAQIYDAGAPAGGQPFIALEYVEGTTITENCRAHGLEVRERLELFLQVLAAVQYAHSHLVIHRDLKPGNILVAKSGPNKSGDVKLLDFGIAKLLTPEGTAQDTELTQAGGRALTLDYASPEQILGQPISTATDIYSLGVVLFELLTGTRPYSLKNDLANAPQQAIRTLHVPRPSEYAQALKGDLDSIVLKALKTEPSERYPSADAFAQDIRRYLSGEPVSAQPESVAYRAKKFVLRHKIAVLASTAVVIALAIGLGVALWQARVAQREARTSQAVREFLTDIFRANSADQPNPAQARQTTARQLLDIGARKIKGGLNDAPEAKLEVLTTLAGMYYDLGIDDEAVKLNRERLALARSIHGNRSPEVAKVLVALGQAMHSSSFVNDRHAVLEEAKKILDEAGDNSSLTRSRLLTALAQEYNSTDQAKAVEFAHQAVELNRRKPPSQELVEALLMEGMMRSGLAQDAQALPLLTEAIELSKKIEGDPNPDLPRLYAYQGEANSALVRRHAAEQSLRNAYQAARALNGADHVDTIQTGMRLGAFLVDIGLFKEGLALLDETHRTAVKIRGADDSFHVPQVRFEYGGALARVGRFEEGLEFIDLAIANRRKNRPGTLYLAHMLEVKAYSLIDQGLFEDAAKALDEASSIHGKVADQRDRLNIIARIKLLLATAKPSEAAQLASETYDKWPAESGLTVNSLRLKRDKATVELARGDAQSARTIASALRQRIVGDAERSYLAFWEAEFALIEGQADLAQGRTSEALPLLHSAITLRMSALDASSLLLAEAEMAAAEGELKAGHRDQAKQLCEQARIIFGSHPRLGPQYTGRLERLRAAGAR